MSEVKRATRVAERLRQELWTALRDLRDPRLAGVLVTRVEVTDDLSLANVFVRRELGYDPAAVKATLKSLGGAQKRLRRAVAQALALRHTPALRFFYDEAPDAVSRIEELLIEVKKGGG
jgi:ribosome-binding factor A